MSERNTSVPPANLNGIQRIGRGMIVEKPKNMKSTLSRLWKLTRGQRKGLGLMLFLSALASLSSVLAPYVIGKGVSAIESGKSVEFLLILLAVLYITDWAVRFLQQWGMAKISQRVIRHIRSVLFGHVSTLPLSFFDKHRHGELMSRLTNDVDNISTTLSNSLTMLMTYFFTVAGIFCFMVTLSPILTAAVVIAVVLIFFLTKTVTAHTKKLFLERQKELGALNGQIEESVSGLSLVKAFCRENKTQAEFDEKNEKLRAVSVKALIWSGFLMPLMNVINNLCYLSVAVLSGALYVKHYISDIALPTSFLLYVRQFTRPFVEIANIYNSFQTAVAGAERIFEILDEAPEPADRENAFTLAGPRGEIVFDHVDFGYSPDKQILKDICLTIPAGTRVAIVGPTGSGKTTLVNLLTRFYDVSGGRITLDGHDLRDCSMVSLREAFGVVLQDTALFADTVRNNIRYGNAGKTDGETERAAIAAGADGFIRRLPQGYDTVLEQGGGELSQGERQLITIARALLTDAPIMILDEATSSVDTVTEQKIRDAMLTVCEGRTSFIIAHRLSTVRDSDLILLMEDGRIKERGSHAELMSRNGTYAEMYRLQTGKSA